MQKDILVAVIGVVGSLLVVLLTHYLRKRYTDKDRPDRLVIEHHHLQPSSRTSEETEVEDRTFYAQRVNTIINLAEKYSSSRKQFDVVTIIFSLLAGVIVTINTKEFGQGFATLFATMIICRIFASLFVNRESTKPLRKEITLSKLDKTALFELKTRSEENKRIHSDLRVYIMKITERELKRL